MHIKHPTAPCSCCYTTVWNIKVSKTSINDKLQGTVAIYLRCGWAVNKQIKKNLLLSVWVKFLMGEYLAKLQARLAKTLLKDKESERQSRSCL